MWPGRLGIAIVSLLLGAALVRHEPPSPVSSATASEEHGDAFAFDVASRFNASVLANIDATDNALTAILAGVIAVLVFTADKISELSALHRAAALVLLAGSAAACTGGYLVSVPWRGPMHGDLVRPLVFVTDFTRQPLAAVADGIRHLVTAGERNVTVRRKKRLLAVSALSLLLAGTAFVIAARLGGRGV